MPANALTSLQREVVQGEVAFVLELEGVAKLFTTTDDAAGLITAWGAPYDASMVHSGLEKPPSFSRSMDLRRWSLETIGLDLRIVDVDGSLAALFADNLTTANVTYATAAIDRDDTSIEVQSTALFPASGVVYMGLERIPYASKDATHFLGCTRGTFPWAGKSSWSHTHPIANGLGLEVSDRPLYWRGRGVSLYAAVKDRETNLWTTKANSVSLFAGYLLDFSEEEGSWTLVTDSVERKLSTKLLRDQLRGDVAEGFELLECFVSVRGRSDSIDGVTGHTEQSDAVTIPAGRYTIDSLIDVINAGLAAEKTAGRIDWDWSLAVVSTDAGWRTAVTVQTDIAVVSDLQVFLDIFGGDFLRLRNILGSASGFAGLIITVAPPDPVVTFYSAGAPVKTELFGLDLSIELEAITGTHAPDSYLGTLYPLADTVVQVEGVTQDPLLWIVDYAETLVDGQRVATLTRKAAVHPTGAPYTASESAIAALAVAAGMSIRVGELRTIEVKQVWLTTQNSIAVNLLRILTSTGTSGYNGASDVLPETMGLGIPSTLIDNGSFIAMAARVGPAGQQIIYIAEPTPAAEFIESACQTLGFALVWRRGKLAAVAPLTIEGHPADWALTPSNMFDRGSMASGADQVITGLTLRYNYDPIADEFLSVFAVDNLPARASIDDDVTFEYEARGIYDRDGTKVAAWVENVAGPLLAYFARPIRKFTVKATRALLGLSLGDVVTLTDDALPDAQAGTYGTDARKAWVGGFTFDAEALEFPSITLLVPPITGRGSALLSPSGMLDYSRGDAGYDSAGPDIYLRPHEFSNDSEDADVTHFDYAHEIAIIEADPADPNAPLAWVRSVVSWDAATHRLRLSSTLSAPAFDTTKRYIVERNTISVGGTPTTGHVFIADDADGLIGDDPNLPAYTWADGLSSAEEETPLGTTLFKYPDDLSASPTFDQFTDARPLSVHKIRAVAEAVNNAIAHVTNQHPLCDLFQTERPTTQGSTAWELLYGPAKIYCPPGVRQLELTWWTRSNAAGGTVPSFTDIESDFNGANLTVYTTGSHTPTANRLQLLTVRYMTNSGSAPPPTSVTGCGLTWVLIDDLEFINSSYSGPPAYVLGGTNAHGVAIYRAMGASPTTEELTITFASTQEAVGWSWSEVADADTSGTHGSGAIVQVGTADLDAVLSITVTLASFSNPLNAVYIAAGASFTRDLTPEAGFTQMHEEVQAGMLTAYKLAPDTSPTVDVVTTCNLGAIAIEIKSANAAPANSCDFRVTLSSVPPGSDEDGVLTFGPDKLQTERTETQATLQRREDVLELVISPENLCYIVIEGRPPTSSDRGYLRGLSAAFAAVVLP